MTHPIAPDATTTLPTKGVQSTVRSIEPSRDVWNGAQEPIAARKSIPLTRSHRTDYCCAVSTVWSLFAYVSCPRQCQWHTARRNGAIDVRCFQRLCFSKWLDVSTSSGRAGKPQSYLQFL